MPRKRSPSPQAAAGPAGSPTLTLSIMRWAKRAGAEIDNLNSDSPADLPFWAAWARATLSERGLLPPPVPAATLADLKGLTRAAEAWGAAVQQFEECGESHPRHSPESLAARLLKAEMIRNGGVVVHDGKEAYWAESSAAMVGEIRLCLEQEATRPDAMRGRKAVQDARAAAKKKAEKARLRSPAHAWRKEVEDRRYGSAEAAYARIERRLGRQPGTVKKAIIRLRQRA